jgi:hypothetical protein
MSEAAPGRHAQLASKSQKFHQQNRPFVTFARRMTGIGAPSPGIMHHSSLLAGMLRPRPIASAMTADR